MLLSAIQDSISKLVEKTDVVTQEDVVLQRLWFTELGGRERTVEMPHEKTFRWLLYDSRSKHQIHENPEDRDQDTNPLTEGALDISRGLCSNRSVGSNDDNDAVSFLTAPDGEGNDAPDILGDFEDDTASTFSEYSVTPAFLKGSKQIRGAWRAEKEWRNQKRDVFLNWLRNGDGIFYCSGKAGSGKSTLMKFLAHDKRTCHELSNWSKAQGKTLIIASFFFWSSGTPLQKRLEGLYRGILWEILRQNPRLIPVVFPDAWSFNEARQTPMAHEPFTMEELESAMNRLFLEAAVTSSHRLCLFLDGLDEYEGDYWKFSKAIRGWAESSKDVKFCLSSRPYNAFLRHFAFDDNRHLSLHELTKSDMYSFVSDQFRQDERYTAIEDDIRQEFDLLSAIVNRSDGVFLWVRLVTVELLRGMGDNCSIQQLIKRLDSIPLGLKSVFEQMLDSIDRTEQQRAAQMFLTMTHDASNFNPSRLVFAQAMLDDLADDPGLAQTLLSGNVGPYLSPADCIGKCHTAGPRAIARCKGLVEVTHSSSEFPYCHQFSFVHRTVGDFFKDAEIQFRLNTSAGDFCLYRRLSQAVLACYKFIHPKYTDPKFINPNQALQCPEYEPRRRLCLNGSATGLNATTDSSPQPLIAFADPDALSLMDPFLEIIRNAESRGISPMVREVESMTSMLRQTADQYHNGETTCYFPRLFFCEEALPWEERGRVATQHLQAAVISYSISVGGMTETAIELASRHPNLLVLSSGKPHVFLSAALRDLYDSYHYCQDPRITPTLMKRAAKIINADCSKRCKIGVMHSRRKDLDQQISTWAVLLLALSQLMRIGKPETSSNISGISRLIELFLQHGADPSVIFIGYSFEKDDMGPTEPRGPLYMDLLGMLTLWKLAPTESTRDTLNVALQKQRQGYMKMSPFSKTMGGDFVPFSIIPYDNLASVSWKDLEETATWVSNHGARKFVFSFDV